jgi:predicted amino acid racemase
MNYPQLRIRLQKIKENARMLLEKCASSGIGVFLVAKVLAGDRRIVEEIAGLGFTHLADSRIENLIAFADIPLPKVLLRLPMASEADLVVRHADISLNSELETIKILDRKAGEQNRTHGVILMFDLGDLREGIFFRDPYLPLVRETLGLQNVRLVGIGTNLVAIKERIEEEFSIRLSLVSGGNSSTLHLLPDLPSGINNLRIGEALFLGRETAFGRILPGLHPDCFELVAELIEVKTKPSYPIGPIGMDSFGRVPDIKDKGLMKRGILAVGKQDAALEDLAPLDEGVEILGGSSDHLLVELKGDFRPGDKLRFAPNYPGLLRLMTSKYVKKVYEE